jgi:Lrp/AsnC family leucine-responsive transcriptional regulator
MSVQLDKLDLKILGELQKDGRISKSKLARNVGASRPTVRNRLKRLTNERLVIIKGGLSLRELEFKMAWVGLEVRTEDTRVEVEQMLKGCPRVLNIFRTPEKANIQITVWGEDENTVKSTIESFRDVPNVEIVYTHYMGTPIHGDITVGVCPAESEETPCGKNCVTCHRYLDEYCIGCPISTEYKNPLSRKK